ncbi:unnamed protein product [Dicrocoelium dendriticum]|nr:unnamed protein product [Dicrocoelium dendriticum]
MAFKIPRLEFPRKIADDNFPFFSRSLSQERNASSQLTSSSSLFSRDELEESSSQSLSEDVGILKYT